MAKKKKLNVKVWVVLGAVALGVVFMLGYGYLKLWHRDPVKAMAKAEVLYGECRKSPEDLNKWDQAAHQFQRATVYAQKTEYEAGHRMKFAQFQLDRLNSTGGRLSQEVQAGIVNKYQDELKAVLRLDPANQEARYQYTDLLWQRGDEEFFQSAEEQFKLSPEDVTRSALTHFRLALRYKSRSGSAPDAAKAEEHFQKAVELMPNEADYWTGWIDYKIERKNAEGALALYQQAIQKSPELARLKVLYALFLLSQPTTDMPAVQAQVAAARASEKKDLQTWLLLAQYERVGKPSVGKQPDFDQAVSDYRQAIALEPTNAYAYIELARLQQVREGPASAVQTLRQGLEQVQTLTGGKRAAELPLPQRIRYQKAHAELHESLATVLLASLGENREERQKYLDDTKVSLGILKEEIPNDPRTSKIEGWLSFAEGNRPEAERLLRKSYEATPQIDLRTAELLITLYLQMNQYGTADQILSRLESAMPANVEVLKLRAQLQLIYRQPDQALATIERAMRGNPDPAQTRTLGELRFQAQAMKGESAGTPPDAIASEDQNSWLRRAAQESDPAVASAIYRAIIKQYPTNLGAVVGLLRLQLAAGQIQQANEVIDEAIRQNPDQAERLGLHKKIVNAASQEERNELILVDIQTQPEGLEKELALANFYRYKTPRTEDDMKQYRRHLEGVVAIDPRTRGALELLFQEYLVANDLSSAERLVDTAGKINADGAGGALYRAMLEIARDQYDSAITILQSIVANRHEFSQAHALLGDAYMAKKKITEAEQSYLTARQQNPANALALVGLARVAEQRNSGSHYQYVSDAYRFAPEHPYIKEQMLRYQEMANPAEAITRREKTLQDDLQQGKLDISNARTLARLHMQAQPPNLERAGQIYEQIRAFTRGKDPNDSLAGLALQIEFLTNTGNAVQARKLLEEALPEEKDRAGVLLMYAQFLAQTTGPDGRLQTEDAFQKAIQAAPDDARGYIALTDYAVSRQDWPRAIEAVQKLKSITPGDPTLDLRLIRLQIDAGLETDALAGIRRRLSANPNDAEALVLDGVISERKGDVREALGKYGQAIAAAPQRLDARIMRARVNMYLGDLMMADQDLEAAHRISATPEIIQLRADVAIRRQRIPQAQDLLREALSLQPQQASIRQRLANLYQQDQDWTSLASLLTDSQKLFPTEPQWRLLEASMWNRQKNAANEVAAMAKAAEIAGNNLEIQAMYVDALLRAKQYDKAIEVAQAHLQDPGAGGIFHAQLGSAQIAKQQVPEGTASVREAFKRARSAEAPDIANLLRLNMQDDVAVPLMQQWEAADGGFALPMALGIIYQQQGKLPEARQSLETALQRASDKAGKFLAARELGTVSYGLGDYAASEKYYKEALVSQDNPEALANLAYVLADKLDKAQEAVTLIRQLGWALPNDANVADTMGTVFLRAKNPEEAINHLTRSVQLAPTSANLFHRAQAYEMRGEADKAKADYRSAWDLVKNNPKDEFYQAIRQRKEALGI